MDVGDPLEHSMFVRAWGREPEFDERPCGNCVDRRGEALFHDYDQHMIRWGRHGVSIPCDEKGCKCRDFACLEHPDGTCVPD